MKSFMLLAVICLVGVTEEVPLHASCRINWTFSLQCLDVKEKLLHQIEHWTFPFGCNNGGEKCLYKFVFQNSTVLKATHETPKKHYIDDLTFTFAQDTNMCNVTGFSTSEISFAVLDDGTNYCNLHNLVVDIISGHQLRWAPPCAWYCCIPQIWSGLDKTPGYSETTSNSICTQFTSRDCSKY